MDKPATSTRLLLLCALATSVAAALSHVQAQVGAQVGAQVQTQVRSPPRTATSADVLELSTGFAPDARIRSGTVRAEHAMPRNPSQRDATNRDGSRTEPCVGRTDDGAMHRVRLATRMGFLRIFAVATRPDADLTLAVHASDGTWLCSDDRFGHQPSVEASLPPGELQIYIGHKGEGAVDYVMSLTETRSVRPRQDLELDGRTLLEEAGLTAPENGGVNGDIRLRRGFLPDPRVLSGTAGGEIDLAVMGGECRGFLSANAVHRVELVSDFGFLGMHVDWSGADAENETPRGERRTEAGELVGIPLAIVVLAPNGELYCRSVSERTWDSGGRPIVARDAWQQGAYWVWVAVSEPHQDTPYRLVLSEVRRVPRD